MSVRVRKSRISLRRSVAMPDNLSAIAEIVNILYKGRADFPVPSDIAGMTEHWRMRLREAMEAKRMSMRAVSLKAKCGPGYVFDILETGKEPTIDRLVRIADAIPVSVSWLLYGYEIGPQEEELLRLYSRLSDRRRRALLDLAESGTQ